MYIFKNLNVESKDYVVRADSMDEAATILADYFNNSVRMSILYTRFGRWRWSKVTSRVIDHTYKFSFNNQRPQYFVVHRIEDTRVTEV